jgi:F0F1-type ATP synthase membrane subunit c/vacuolar-type H+-ATPase subunit K
MIRASLRQLLRSKATRNAQRRVAVLCAGLLVCLVALAAGGCAGYRLGPTIGMAAQGKSVQVNPFINQTLEPGIADAVTAQLHKQLQRDGTYRLATHNDGDIIVSGAITRYNRHELSFTPKDVLTVRDYQVSLTAEVTARDRISGKVILQQTVTGYTLVRTGSDLASSERQTLPLLAADLAKNVTALLGEGSW